MRYFGLACALLALAASGALASTNRYWLASQHNWPAKHGFILSLDNDTPGNTSCRLDTLQLVFGTANGRDWRYSFAKPAWQTGRDYRVKVVIAPAGAKLWLDGKLVADQNGPFEPDMGYLQAHMVPDYYAGPADYRILQSSLRLELNGRERTFDYSYGPPLKPAMLLYGAGVPGTTISYRISASDTLTLDTTFRIERMPDARSASPLVDRYGQLAAADFPGKVKTDADLKRAQVEEDRRLRTWGAPAGYDCYGGWKGAAWKGKATGYFGVARHGAKWWLISPEGNPCFYVGLCTVPALAWEKTPVTGREWQFAWLPSRTGEYAACWDRDVWQQEPGIEYVALHTANIIRKFGRAWQAKENALTARRLRDWGFSGMSKWADGALPGVVTMPVLDRKGVPNVAGHPDVFDPQVQTAFRKDLRRQMAPRIKDPFILGWSLGNEIYEIITSAEIREVLKKPGTLALKRALLAYALEALYRGDMGKLASAWGVSAPTLEALYGTQPVPPAVDLEEMRRFYSRAYYGFIYRTIKQIDPNHLYFGNWIVPGWWENESDWGLVADYCDVIGYDYYAEDFIEPNFSRLMRETDKPVFCGEFSFPPTYHGRKGYGQYKAYADDDAQAGDKYARWMRDAVANPYCVGVSWFEYRDEPVSGRGAGHGPNVVYGENNAFGLVDVTDRPKWDLVERVRKANLLAAKSRK